MKKPTYEELEARVAELAGKIEELRRTEDRLKENEERFQTFFERSNVGMVLARFDGGESGNEFYLEPNSSVLEFLGYSKEEFTGKRIAEISHPDDFEEDQRLFSEMLAGERDSYKLEKRYIRKDGGVVWGRLNATVRRDREGRPVGGFAIIEDITERKRAEEALRTSEERLRSTLENLMEGCQIIGYDWRYLYLNEVAARHGRRPREELLGRTMMEAYPGIETTEMFGALRRCMENRFPEQMRNEFVFPDGSSGWFELVIQPVPEGVFIMSSDITERKRTEAALLASEMNYREIFDNSNEAIFVHDMADGTILDLNRTMLEMYGYSKPDAVKLNIEAFSSGEPPYTQKEAEKKVGKAVEEGPQLFEWMAKKKNGELFWVEVNLKRATIGGNERILAFVTDITERKRAEEEIKRYSERLEDLVEERTRELKQAQEKLLAAERLAVLGQFAGSIAHEIRNPLGVISGLAYYLKRRAVTDDEKYLSRIDEIKKQVERTSDIIESILKLTRMGAPSAEPVDLIDAARSAVISSRLPGGIAVEWDQPVERIIVPADKNQLDIAFKNIIQNAAQAMGGGGTLTVGARAVTEEGADWAEITFFDTGPGIEKENLDKIFEPLFTTKIYGIGFGLSIVRMVVEKHGGTVSAASGPGGVTVFTVRLPAKAKEGK